MAQLLAVEFLPTDIFVHDGAADDLQEVRVQLGGHSSRQQSLASPGWTVQQTALATRWYYWNNSTH